MEMPLHLILEHSKWFAKDLEKEQKALREYDLAILKAVRCPFATMFRKGKG